MWQFVYVKTGQTNEILFVPVFSEGSVSFASSLDSFFVDLILSLASLWFHPAMKKRSLAHAEKQEGTPSKQARLNFSGGLLTVTEDMGLPARNMGSFFNKAIVPLKGTSWESKISFELNQPYMRDLFMRLDQKVSEVRTYLCDSTWYFLIQGKTIYPPVNLIFNAFVLTPFDRVRVVIIGQDPYHNPGQAHGLSFSVPPGVSQPPSLKNIFKELSAEYPSFKTPKHGSLVKWAMQGVFL